MAFTAQINAVTASAPGTADVDVTYYDDQSSYSIRKTLNLSVDAALDDQTLEDALTVVIKEDAGRHKDTEETAKRLQALVGQKFVIGK